MSGSRSAPYADPILAAPTLEVLGSGSSAGDTGQNVITNATQPVFGGTLIPGDEVLVFVDNAQMGGFASSSPGSSTYTSIPPIPLTPGVHQAKAEQLSPNATMAQEAVSGYSAPVNLLVLPAPVNGLTTAGVSSAQINTLLNQGYTMQLVSGTEAVRLTNGTLSIGADTNEAVVQRLYEGLLGRAGDTGGLTLYDGLLSNGVAPAAVATDLLNSPGYQTLHGTLSGISDTQFVTNLYQDFFGRSPDLAGLNSWLTAIAQGTSRGQVVAGFAQSDEAKAFLAADTAHVWVPNVDGALTTQLYATGLGRTPDAAGLQLWVQALQSGLTPAQMAMDLAG